MKKITTIYLSAAVLAFLSLGLAGCATPPATNNVVEDQDLVGNSYRAADAMLAQVPWLKDSHKPLLTATFVNVNALENSSALGRIVSEQVASRLSQLGFTVIEMKLRNNIFIKENAGEFVLSRSVRDLSQSHNAAAVVAGTYAVGRQSVYVSVRLIRALDSLILASYDYSLPLGPDTKALLASQ